MSKTRIEEINQDILMKIEPFETFEDMEAGSYAELGEAIELIVENASRTAKLSENWVLCHIIGGEDAYYLEFLSMMDLKSFEKNMDARVIKLMTHLSTVGAIKVLVEHTLFGDNRVDID